MPVTRIYDKDFFKTWTKEMSYILGFLYADGNIIKTKRGTHYVAWYTADRDLLEEMKRTVRAEHKIQLRAAKSGKNYRMQVGSHEWFRDLGLLGLFPNKARRMTLPEIPLKFRGDFIRGYFDGDGNVWVGNIHTDRLKVTKTIQVSFTSASKGFLLSLRDLLRVEGLKGGGLYTEKEGNYSRLTFSVRDALKIYKIMYNAEHKLLLKRKKQVFENFFSCGGSSTG